MATAAEIKQFIRDEYRRQNPDNEHAEFRVLRNDNGRTDCNWKVVRDSELSNNDKHHFATAYVRAMRDYPWLDDE